ncbi:Maf family nucleotide pyrophosphatase [Ornithinimicrobium sp. Arc0846-15]|nr:Maf family nucleotide pyrophosphatase [Ornithinimicrobium laminariae]
MTPEIQMILASKSPARLATLRSAGVEPRVLVSGVDEDAVVAKAGPLPAAEVPLLLAQAKAEAVAAQWWECEVADRPHADVLLGCDSMLELDGDVWGKPEDAAAARDRWRSMRGRSGILHSGHWLIDLRDSSVGRGATASTIVHFSDISDAEIDAYVATGEPLWVAGGFTVDGLGGPFVTGIEGDFHNVVGVSLPVLRSMLGDLGIAWHQLRTAN